MSDELFYTYEPPCEWHRAAEVKGERMQRKWSDEELRKGLASTIWGYCGDDDVTADIVRSVMGRLFEVRDDLTAAHERTRKAAWRILKANAELRARVAELEAQLDEAAKAIGELKIENTRLYTSLAITQFGYDVALAQLEGGNHADTD